MKKSTGSILFILSLVVIGFIYLYFETTDSPSPPTGLHPKVKKGMEQLIKKSAEKGIKVVITDGYRSFEDQNRLYSKGRTVSGSIVTNAKGGESYHNFGLAIDFALRNSSGEIIWDMQYDGNKNGRPDWDEVVETAKSIGFQWGGDWVQFKDNPHLQMDFGLTLDELKNGMKPNETALIFETK